MAAQHGELSHLLPLTYKRMIAAWLEEDCPSVDYGGFVVGEVEGEAKLLGKSKGMVAGVPFFNEVFAQLDCTTSSLLTILRSHGWNGILAGTRKTTPGFRLIEKYGILVGGADPHRHDLSSMTMLKDNHIWACYNKDRASHTSSGETITIADAIPSAVSAARAAGGFAVKIEVECRSVEEANAAIGAGADIVMLDNFSPDGVREAARQLKDEWDAKGKPPGTFLVEVSGGLRENNVAEFACEHVDILSTSSIHQGVGIVDFSLKVTLR
ncbi:nicotinate-nucleotide diphosphorylase (carboxylating) [Emydomyces testavorans]|uniref:Nicotinate-nucleotide pyrophosphorylase [carboxylating] n=1 Tax=Emydomyces testavorans TaxID=2070801 RepID=A0AAF0IL57_9EURO|nr:nicotinate-nucleotide diphosphorylase (carboxylating) [Emydomyces testavorans]